MKTTTIYNTIRSMLIEHTNIGAVMFAFFNAHGYKLDKHQLITLAKETAYGAGEYYTKDIDDCSLFLENIATALDLTGGDNFKWRGTTFLWNEDSEQWFTEDPFFHGSDNLDYIPSDFYIDLQWIEEEQEVI